MGPRPTSALPPSTPSTPPAPSVLPAPSPRRHPTPSPQLASLLVIGLLAGACASQPAPVLPLPLLAGSDATLTIGPPGTHAVSSVEVTGDWDDVRAAIDPALIAAEIALIPGVTGDATLLAETAVVYKVISIDDEPGTIAVARRTAPEAPASATPAASPSAAAAGPTPIVLAITIGDPPNRDRERRFLEAFVARLRQLKGIDAAPVPD
jgi:hypothetical protein